jgi:hypothetical protein
MLSVAMPYPLYLHSVSFVNQSLFDKRPLSCVAIEAALRPSLFTTHWTIHWTTDFPPNWTIDWTTHFPTVWIPFRTAHSLHHPTNY